MTTIDYLARWREKEALQQVNEIRRFLNLKPRKTLAKGVPRDHRHCPIASSIPPRFSPTASKDFLTASVPPSKRHPKGRHIAIAPSRPTRSFMVFFDNGLHNHLLK